MMNKTSENTMATTKKKAPEKQEEKDEPVKKKTPKLPGFVNFKSKKFVLMIVFVGLFAALGSYWLYAKSSANVAKDLTTIKGCRASGVVLKQGSTGSCVKVVQVILFYAKNRYGSSAPWPAGLYSDGIYGPKTAEAVTGYQKIMNSRFKAGIAVDGVVGPDTWRWLNDIACPDIFNGGYRIKACGYN